MSKNRLGLASLALLAACGGSQHTDTAPEQTVVVEAVEAERTQDEVELSAEDFNSAVIQCTALSGMVRELGMQREQNLETLQHLDLPEKEALTEALVAYSAAIAALAAKESELTYLRDNNEGVTAEDLTLAECELDQARANATEALQGVRDAVQVLEEQVQLISEQGNLQTVLDQFILVRAAECMDTAINDGAGDSTEFEEAIAALTEMISADNARAAEVGGCQTLALDVIPEISFPFADDLARAVNSYINVCLLDNDGTVTLEYVPVNSFELGNGESVSCVEQRVGAALSHTNYFFIPDNAE